jgi:hypothetical protein
VLARIRDKNNKAMLPRVCATSSTTVHGFTQTYRAVELPVAVLGAPSGRLSYSQREPRA